ncbi:MAG: hypothetical protein LBU23_04360 [Planctomycetota bacterium]|nr:hypothetical protein [Planctomycetota bacterium]
MGQSFDGGILADFYLLLAAISTLLFALRLAAFFFFGSGAELGSGADAAGALESDASFDYLSLQSILAFLMGFSWIGLAGLRQWGLGSGASFILALAAGAVLLFFSAFLMRQVMRLDSSPSQDYGDALGRTGMAYTNFTADGGGRVQIEINGKLTVANAINAGGGEINSFDRIRVVEVEDCLLRVEKAAGGE